MLVLVTSPFWKSCFLFPFAAAERALPLSKSGCYKNSGKVALAGWRQGDLQSHASRGERIGGGEEGTKSAPLELWAEERRNKTGREKKGRRDRKGGREEGCRHGFVGIGRKKKRWGLAFNKGI